MYRLKCLFFRGGGYNPRMPYVLFVSMCLIWGTSFLLMRWAAAVFNAPAIGAGRMLGGSLALLAVWLVLRALRGGRGGWPMTRRDLAGLGVVVVFGFVVPWTLQPHLIGTYRQSGFFGMMVSLVPLLTMAVSVPMLGQKPTARQGLGVLLGLGMVLVLVRDGVSARGVPVWAMGLAVLVPACYAVSNTFVKKRFHDADTVALSASAMAGALIFLLPLARLNPQPDADASMSQGLLALAILGVVCSGIGMWMFYTMVQLRGPLFAGMVTYIVPGVAVLLGYAIEDEPVTASQLLALGGILISVGLVQWPTRSVQLKAAPPVRVAAEPD